MPSVRVQLLGGFSASLDGRAVPESAWRLKKARELVKLLALAPGHRLHREQAMDLLWPDRDPAAAANNLNQAVHVARKALDAEAIAARDESLVLEASVDVDELLEAAAAARRAGTPAAHRAALALWAGELLPENRYDDWAQERRERLAELHAELAAHAAPASEARFALPADASSFVGRGHELAELRALLARTRLLTLAGTGGAGKTRLALELAREREQAFSDGAVLAELSAVSDGALVDDVVAAALDVRALPGRPLVDALVDFVAQRELLLVLDNCEHVLTSAAALADALLRGAPRVTVLATSREPLRLPAELVFRVPSLSIPDPEHAAAPEALLRYEAVRLFAERAAAAGAEFAVDAENAADVARICFRLDGLPLALELAAGRVGALGTAAIAARLDDRFRLLRAGSSSAPTRQQTLEATLQWSHDLLEADEAVLLRRLAVFAGGFELEAAEDVCAGAGLDRADVADLLSRLVEKSLVAVEARGAERRYRLLETIRAYARARLGEAGEAEDAAGRHADWALELVERERDTPRLDRESANLRVALDTLFERRPREALRFCAAVWPFWMRRIELGEAQRRFADALAAAPEPTALRAEALLAAAAVHFRAGTLSQGNALAEESLATATAIDDPRAEWRAVHLLCGFGFAEDDPAVALHWLERCVELAERAELPAAGALATYLRGAARWVAGDPDGADELLGRSLEAFRALAGSSERIPSPVNLAEMRTPHEAGGGLRIVFEETLQPFLEISCDAAAGYVLANRGNVARSAGDLERAGALLAEALSHFERLGDERGRADVLARLAYLALARGAVPEARERFGEALELRRALGDRRGVGLVLSGLGRAETVARRYARAEEHLAEAVGIFRRAGDRWGLASALWRTADLAFARGRPAEAEAVLEEALAVVRPTGREGWIAATLAGLAEARGEAPAKPPLRPRKGRRDRTSPTRTTKGRRP